MRRDIPLFSFWFLKRLGQLCTTSCKRLTVLRAPRSLHLVFSAGPLAETKGTTKKVKTLSAKVDDATFEAFEQFCASANTNPNRVLTHYVKCILADKDVVEDPAAVLLAPDLLVVARAATEARVYARVAASLLALQFKHQSPGGFDAFLRTLDVPSRALLAMAVDGGVTDRETATLRTDGASS